MSEPETAAQLPSGAPSGVPPGGAEPPLSFDAWAELSARMLKLDQEGRLTLLEEREVEVEDWDRSQHHWVMALAADVTAGRMDRPRSYGRRCAAEMAPPKAAEAAQPEPAEAAPPESKPAEAAPPKPTEATLPKPAEAVRPPPAAPIAPKPENPAETAMAFVLPTALRPEAKTVLPFQSGGPSPLAAPPSEPRPRPVPSSDAGATLDAGVNLMAHLRPALPFMKGAAGETPPPATGAKPPGPVDEPTVTLDASAEPPKAPAPPVAFPRMPLQTYASFCAEMALFPEKAAEIFGKYLVQGEAARAALDRDWRARFDAHAETKAEWERLFVTYSEWLRNRPR